MKTYDKIDLIGWLIFREHMRAPRHARVYSSFRYSFCKDADQALLALPEHSIFAREISASGLLSPLNIRSLLE